jgi:hypothetical protein
MTGISVICWVFDQKKTLLRPNCPNFENVSRIVLSALPGD